MRTLGVGETASDLVIDSRVHWNVTGIVLGSNQTYRFETPSDAWWSDSSIRCGPEGYRKALFRPLEGFRRVPQAAWFELVGAVGEDEPALFRIGRGCDYPVTRSGHLRLFANDLWFMYWNNHGAISVNLTRVR